ncbi:MAG TPA: MMPL family transporter [Rhizobacter sp.]
MNPGEGLHRAAVLLRRGVLVVWLACVAAAIGIAWRTHYVADLSAFLPSTPSAEQAVLLDQLRSGVAARLALIGLEGGTPAARQQASRQLAQALRESGAFDAVHNGDNTQFEATGKFLFEHRYLLSPAVDPQRFSVEGLKAGIDDTTSLLGTPAGALIKPVILRDPTGETIRMAEGMLPAQSPRMDGGVWVSRDGRRAVLLATTRADGADLDGQQRALQTVRERFAALQAEGVSLILTGPASFSVGSRDKIKREVEMLALAGGVAIVGILLFSFGGSLRTLMYAVLPVGCGVLAGVAAVSLAFGNVHGMTLGFGTTLIGEAVDYAIYYLIQARSRPGAPKGDGARRWTAESWPTVRLGLWTSICGFAALLFSGFPGLAQLGLFSVAGLAAAALTTRYVFTVIAPDGAPGVGMRRKLGEAVGWCSEVLPRARWPLVALTVAAAAALAWWPSAWTANLAALNPVGAEQIRLDEELRQDIGASDNGTIVAVAAGDEASVLAQAEAAGERLDRLVASGAIGGYESPARLLPSPATQQRRREALPERAVLAANLEAATADGPLPARRLQAFLDDVQAARQQPALTLASLKDTPLAAALSAQVLPGDGTRPWRALLRVQALDQQPVDLAALRSALADLPGTHVVNIADEVSALYARYLKEALVQALLGALAVCVLLAVHLRSWRRLLRIAQPVAASVLLVLAVMTGLGVALGILHLVGLLLAVAIGSNYALFFDQIRAQQEAQPPGTAVHVDTDTLASLALANITAGISFLLLAFSSIPVLSAVGQVVAPGIVLSLLLSAAFIPRRQA